MTLVEMLVGLGVGSLVLAGVMGTTMFTARNFVAIGNYCDLSSAGRNSLDLMSEDIRQARSLLGYSYKTNTLIFLMTDPVSRTNAVLTYTYNPTARTLTRSLRLQGGVLVTNTPMLTNCIYFHFDLYQRNPSLANGGDLVGLISTNQPSLVKAVDLTWVCSRSVLGMTYNSEDVQSARVIIRKN